MSRAANTLYGPCEMPGCQFVGDVVINSDYDYLCLNHMTLYVKMHRMHSFMNKVAHTEHEIAKLRNRVADLECDLPGQKAEAEKAKEEWEVARTFSKLAEVHNG